MEIKKGELYLSDEHIINVQDYNETHIYGFDLFTESLVKVARKDVVPIKKSIYKLMGNESAQYFLARHNSKYGSEMAEKMNISERTFFRIQRKVEGVSNGVLEETD